MAMRRILGDSQLANAAQSAGILLIVGGLLIPLGGVLWKSGYESAAIAVSVGSGVLIALGCIWFLAVLGLITLKPESISFVIRDYDVDLPVYSMDRAQPITLVQLTARGHLFNRNSRKVVVHVVSAKLLRRQLWWWRFVAYAAPLSLLSIFGGVIDLVFHGVEVDGDSRSDMIREIWAYFSVPPEWDLDKLSSGNYRAIITVIPAGQRNGQGVKCDFELSEAIEMREIAHQRFRNSRLYEQMNRAGRITDQAEQRDDGDGTALTETPSPEPTPGTASPQPQSAP